MTTQNFTLTGYEIVDRIYSGTRTLVYRGFRTSDKQPVAIKVLRSEYPSFSELVQFRNQYTIAKNLNLPGIIETYSLETYQNSYALVMEDFGGISLKEWREQAETAPNLRDFLQMAIDISGTLDILCRHRIIHKDIKPANILINPETKQVKLIDFSIASLLPRETQTLMNPNVLEGTLCYLSPEQTGRMNRGIDYRTDFYSLGVTFYELLAGELPFQSNDPMELVHSHIAKQPPSLHSMKPEIPQVLSQIVSKLMAKNAEDRYQSALGLKFDLEFCLRQLEESGQIGIFAVAQRDLCDRFIIPEKLYGRETEVKTLLEAFERVASPLTKGGQRGVEMMLVAGFSGIGKTVVVNEVHKPIVRQRGYFIKGKFDQFNRNIPFSAFVQAFRDLMGQLLSESDEKLEKWQTQILQALGDNGQVIIEVIPELETIIGQQPPATELSGTAAQNRFNLVFQNFIRVFTAKEHPLVMFLDDLQWADSASLQLMQLLMSESKTNYLLVIGAYRDNEVFAAHPLMLTLNAVVKTGATVNTITLEPLSSKSLNNLIADTLNCTPDLATPLTDLVAQKTQGNPFFATQFLKALHQDGLISFTPVAPPDRGGSYGGWQCDIARVREAALTDDVVEFMALQLQKLPAITQDILKLAACIGNQFDLNTLAIVSAGSQTEVATSLWKALQSGLILPQSEVYKFYVGESIHDKEQDAQIVNYKFLHDRVQQAAYSLIAEDQKQSTHLKIGFLLLQSITETERELNIFNIVNQLNLGIDALAAESFTKAKQVTKDELAELNLIAGRKAKASAAYEAALRYSNTALTLLTENSWEDQYEFSLALHLETIELEYLNANFARSAELAELTLQHTKTVLDKVAVHQLKIQFHIAQNNMLKAIETGLKALDILGFSLSLSSDIDLANIEIPSLDSVNSLQAMTDPFELAKVQILASLISPAYFAQPDLFPKVTLAVIQASFEYGYSALSAVGYGFGALLFLKPGYIDPGYHSGLLSLQLLERFHAKEIESKLQLIFNVFIRPHKERGRASLIPFLNGLQAGLDTGEFEYASYCAMNYCNHLFFTGENLKETKQLQEQYRDLLVKLKLEFSMLFFGIWRQAALNLMGESVEATHLVGESFDETLTIPQLKISNSFTLLFSVYVAKSILLYLLGNYTACLEHSILASECINSEFSPMMVSLHKFYYSLALLANYPDADLAIVESNQETLQKWADYAPMNFKHKYDLVVAEKNRILEQKTEAIELYDRAIAGAKANEYIQEEALANELAAKFYLDWGKEKVAAGYMQEAYYCYARWGAKAKIDDLEKRYPQLLVPILQPGRDRHFLTENRLQTADKSSLSDRTIQTISSSSSISESLDFATICKVSQALSSEIQLDQLLSTFLQVLIENAGATKAALLLLKDDNLTVEALANLNESVTLLSIPLASSELLPVTAIDYVKRTLKTVVLDDATAGTDFMADSYFVQQQPKSVLCTPIVYQGKLIGLLYLENNLTIGAFTDDRTLVIQLLCAQAAISLENASLYQQSQAYAQELERSLFDLQQAQLQLVQSEKMSALGNLVAGVAHEINNPVGFINGNIDEATTTIKDVINHLKLYQEKLPNPGEEIEQDAEDIDLEYALADLPKMLSSMKVGCDRIRGISTSLRTFSRADKDYKVPFNIHEGIDSTLLILKHRLKANEHRPAIEVVTDYGNLPRIECFPGQLNQVFMNLLSNAIDALDESSQGRSFDRIEANPNCIRVRSGLEGDRHIKITIADNGAGMTESVKQRIFDHLFTTKAVGKGTGLGLAIARQIVVETHGGKLSCNSAVGEGTEFAIVLPVSQESH
ncbi:MULTISPECIES: ATP-binding sensor histidine kinase [unclassified Microcoleus]|uniref:trifunctional serine/threonine-protein kinase/ATP-binding protein/sensor histidine kinase n=1 Tax=unclassified Microcoleus TaxID=2642155 RepID=UPI0025E379F5|nr:MULTISPECIES: ATP-binding sensor histidine kinase [unclassified Microcoleus]